MRKSILNWYHYILNHPGGDRVRNTIKKNSIVKVFPIRRRNMFILSKSVKNTKITSTDMYHLKQYNIWYHGEPYT